MNAKRQSSYDTNMASEFFVMSQLHRLGLEAHLGLAHFDAPSFHAVLGSKPRFLTASWPSKVREIRTSSPFS